MYHSAVPRLQLPNHSTDYRGRCKYKSGRCPNERTLKYNGEEIHSLCEEHRIRHNRNQRKADTKRRKGKIDDGTSSTASMSPRMLSNKPRINNINLFHHSLPIEESFNEDLSWTTNEDDMNFYFQNENSTWSNEDVALLMEYFVDSKC